MLLLICFRCSSVWLPEQPTEKAEAEIKSVAKRSAERSAEMLSILG